MHFPACARYSRAEGRGPKKQAVTRGWKELRYAEFSNFYFSPNIVKAINSNTCRMNGARHVARIGGMQVGYKISVDEPNGRDHLGEINIEG
jgi:hypothetical protein